MADAPAAARTHRTLWHVGWLSPNVTEASMTPMRALSSPVALAMVWLASMGAAAAQTTVTLEGAMAQARADTPDRRALESDLAAAEARVRRAQSGYWPRVDLVEAVQRGNHPVFAFSALLSQRRFTAADFALESLNHPDAVTNTRTAIGIEQPIFDAGLTMLGTKAAKLERDAAAVRRDEGEQDLAFAAAQAFVAVLRFEAAGRATDAAVAAAESDRERARARRDVGLATEADVLAVAVHLANMRQRQIAVRGDLEVARTQLAEAIGAPFSESLVLVPPAPRALPDDVSAIVTAALASHPHRRQSDLHVQRADVARRTARASLLPTVGLQGGWEFNGPTLGEQRAGWVVGAEVRLNVFRGFADSSRVAEASHALTRASADQERVLRRIEVEVRSAAAQLTAAAARRDAGQAALAQAHESQRIIRDRYDNGMATMTDVLRAAEAVLDAESRSTAADMDVILRAVALDRAAGRL
jgi:outer membrane protein TolC